MNVGIIYGWSEGPWQGKLLRRSLHTAGYSITKDIETADILIAHSGGCYTLPDKTTARLILLVGLPFHPSQHPLVSLREKLRHEIKDWWWLKKTIHNMYYLLTRPLTWFRMWRAWKQTNLPTHENIEVIAIRNDQDNFMHPLDSVKLIEQKGWRLKKLRGHHDDIWRNPAPYVKIIKEYTS